MQHTLSTATHTEGIGVHSGAPVAVALHPAPPGTGVRLRRADVPVAIAIGVESVVDSRLATVLGGPGWTVATVEHLLAALYAEAIDNVEIVVDGPEVPVLDGSAAGWVAVLRAAGRQAQPAPRAVLVVHAPITVSDGPRAARLLPAPRLSLAAAIRFEHPAIGDQRYEIDVDADTFSREVAWARSFGFAHEAEALRALGLARGSSLDNALVYGPDGVLNPEGARAPDEPVRHKLLDMLGDLALLGLPVRARFEAERPGHALSARLMAAVRDNPQSWRVETD